MMLKPGESQVSRSFHTKELMLHIVLFETHHYVKWPWVVSFIFVWPDFEDIQTGRIPGFKVTPHEGTIITQFISHSTELCGVGCSAKQLFLSYVLPSTYMVPLGDWSPQKKFQHYRPKIDFGIAIWSFDLFYNVKTAEIGPKIFKINKMAKNHFLR